MGEISPGVLAKEVLSLSPFSNISPEDFKLLLRYLIDIDQIHRTESGKLIIGLAGEKIVGKYQFYAVFPETKEYIVKHESNAIGSIVIVPTVGSQFGLAGRSWQVLDVDFRKKTISVKPVEGQAGIYWRGGAGKIHSKVLQRMHRVLIEDIEYRYLQKNALQRLRKARQLAKENELDKCNIVRLQKGKCCIFPWMGTAAYRTLERLINSFCRESLEIKSIGGLNPYFITLKLPKDKFENIYPEIVSLCEQRIIPEHLVSETEAPEVEKYDRFIPYPLLRKAFVADYLDLDEVRELVALWKKS